MNFNAFLDLDGPDVIMVILILLLLWGARGLSGMAGQLGDELRRWQGEPPESPKAKPSLTSANRWIFLLILFFLLLAGAIWLFRPQH